MWSAVPQALVEEPSLCRWCVWETPSKTQPALAIPPPRIRHRPQRPQAAGRLAAGLALTCDQRSGPLASGGREPSPSSEPLRSHTLASAKQRVRVTGRSTGSGESGAGARPNSPGHQGGRRACAVSHGRPGSQPTPTGWELCQVREIATMTAALGTRRRVRAASRTGRWSPQQLPQGQPRDALPQHGQQPPRA